jgi:hypothetical protein
LLDRVQMTHSSFWERATQGITNRKGDNYDTVLFSTYFGELKILDCPSLPLVGSACSHLYCVHSVLEPTQWIDNPLCGVADLSWFRLLRTESVCCMKPLEDATAIGFYGKFV